MSLEERIERALEERYRAQEAVWRLVTETRRSEDLDEPERRRLLARLYQSLAPSEVRVEHMRHLYGHGIGISYVSQLVELMHLKRQLASHGYRIAPGGAPKMTDRTFARTLGIPAARTSELGLVFDEIELQPNTVIKPVAGHSSIGVFFVDDELRLTSLRSRKMFRDRAEARAEVEEIKPGITAKKWMVEEAVIGPHGGPANDIKVHVFYGAVGAVLEVAHRAGPKGEDLFCYYGPEMTPIDIGRKKVKTFSGTGVPQSALERAVQLSLEVPVPFLRVDFLKGTDECVLGEITPHPGASFAGNINTEYDRLLGRLFLDAKARLLVDVSEGKSFDTYFDVYGKDGRGTRDGDQEKVTGPARPSVPKVPTAPRVQEPSPARSRLPWRKRR